MMDLISKIRQAEDGQTMAEYAVILGVITLLVVVALTTLSGAITTALGNVAGIIGGGAQAPPQHPAQRRT
jgi:Flp pilus assembly pilin Flp